MLSHYSILYHITVYYTYTHLSYHSSETEIYIHWGKEKQNMELNLFLSLMYTCEKRLSKWELRSLGAWLDPHSIQTNSFSSKVLSNGQSTMQYFVYGQLHEVWKFSLVIINPTIQPNGTRQTSDHFH